MIRVILPAHLRTLAGAAQQEVQVEIEAPATQRTLLNAIEARYPMLRGTLREPVTQQRRAYLRFFVAMEDFSHVDLDTPLPAAVVTGETPFRIIGAIAGG